MSQGAARDDRDPVLPAAGGVAGPPGGRCCRIRAGHGVAGVAGEPATPAARHAAPRIPKGCVVPGAARIGDGDRPRRVPRHPRTALLVPPGGERAGLPAQVLPARCPGGIGGDLQRRGPRARREGREGVRGRLRRKLPKAAAKFSDQVKSCWSSSTTAEHWIHLRTQSGGRVGRDGHAVPVRPERCLGAVGDPDGVEDGGEVRFHGGLADAEPAGDVLVGAALA